MAVSKRTRFEVLKRDNHTCRYCGGKAPDVVLTVDHVIPVALGGTDDPSNLVAACKDCNAGKTSTSPSGELVADVAEAALGWSSAIQQAAQELRDQRDAVQAMLDDWHQEWAVWGYTNAAGERVGVQLPSDWESSLRALLESGADLQSLIELVPVAMRSKARDEFKYFCGCGWNHVRALQARAQQILEHPDEPALPVPRWAADDTRESYWDGHGDGYNAGYEDGWELGMHAGQKERHAQPDLGSAPLSLADILKPPKEVT